MINDNFVAIKVDREERPDVDAVYMQATQALTGQGGWPMSVFLTPDRLPFYAGTYFPPAPRHGLPAFSAGAGGDQRGLDAAAGRGADQRRDRSSRSFAERPLGRGCRRADHRGRLRRRGRAAAGEFDPEHGGFGGAPKFPPSMVLEALLRDGGEPAMIDGRADLRRDGPRRHLRPAGRRIRPLQRRRRLGGAALREDALRQRPAARGLHPLVAAHPRTRWPSGWWPRRRLAAARDADARGRLRREPGRRLARRCMVACARAPTTPGPGTSSTRGARGRRTRSGRRRCSG